MAYTIKAAGIPTNSGTFQAERETRKDAHEVAASLMGQGLKNVTITDDQGHVFELSRFDEFLVEKDR